MESLQEDLVAQGTFDSFDDPPARFIYERAEDLHSTRSRCRGAVLAQTMSEIVIAGYGTHYGNDFVVCPKRLEIIFDFDVRAVFKQASL